MKFRRKSTSEAIEIDLDAIPDSGEIDTVEVVEDAGSADAAEGAEAVVEAHGPYDAAELPADAPAITRIDLGSLHIPAVDGLELRLQVDENTGEIAAVMLTGEDGAIELRAFAAPRNGDLWGEVLPQLAADVQGRGGQVAQREGNFGPELVCQLSVTTPEGEQGVQPSRILGINGPRWLLRATFLGRPAVEMEVGTAWEGILRHVVVDRGRTAMPKGEALPIVIPPQAQQVPPA